MDAAGLGSHGSPLNYRKRGEGKCLFVPLCWGIITILSLTGRAAPIFPLLAESVFKGLSLPPSALGTEQGMNTSGSSGKQP